MDSRKLNEILLFVKLYHPDINVTLLDDNLIKQFEEIKTNYVDKWKNVIKYRYFNLYLWICKITIKL